MNSIPTIYCTEADRESLSLVKTVPVAPVSDYARVVVQKPWGYEYLLYENACVAIWVLYLKPRARTSLHCHIRKRTSLAVLSGGAITSTIDSRQALGLVDGVILEPGVFHSTAAAAEGALVMEIESPPQKQDLYRLRDAYGREGTAYESSNHWSPVGPEEHAAIPTPFGERAQRQLGDVMVQLTRVPNGAPLAEVAAAGCKSLLGVCAGAIVTDAGGALLRPGAICRTHEVLSCRGAKAAEGLELLSVEQKGLRETDEAIGLHR